MNALVLSAYNEVDFELYGRELTLEEIESVEGGNLVGATAVVVGGGLIASVIAGSNYDRTNGYSFSGQQAADSWRSTMEGMRNMF